MKKQDLIKFGIIGFVILVIFILIIVVLDNNKYDSNIKLNGVSKNYVVDDDIVMLLYNRYNPENELLFDLVGSNRNDSYAYYYKNKKVSYNDLSSEIKNMILLNDADYKSGTYDDKRKCYYMSKDSFKVIYKKLFGHEDYDLSKFSLNVSDDGNNLCIGIKDNNEYTKMIDTYMVNAVRDGKYINIYEKVAFIKIDNNYLYFYRDYKMKELVYKIKIDDKLDKSFINNYSVVSNVLLKYQDEFDLYEYTYVEGEDSYYLESISR